MRILPFRTSLLRYSILLLVFLPFHIASASTLLANSTLQTMTHPRPVITSVDPSKTDSISLEGSSTLKIFRNSVNGIQLWRFEVDHAYWWVSPIGIIWGKGTHVASSYDSLLEASNDVEAYSRYLAIKAQSL